MGSGASTRRARRRASAVVAVLAAIGGALVALAPQAAAGGEIVVTVAKVVKGTAPTGATFTVNYSCTGAGTASGSVSFDASGTPTPPNDFTVGNDTTCTFSETASHPAANVAFVCTEGAVAPDQVTCAGDGTSFVYDQAAANTSTATITVTNAYANVLGPLTIDPSSGSAVPGQSVMVSGTGCTKDLFGGSADTGGTVQVTANFPAPITLNTTAAGTTGAWSVTFTVPTNANGAYTINASCGDPVPYAPVTLNVAGTSASAPTAVVAAPTTTG